MAKQYFLLVGNNGDGSSSISLCDSKETVDALIESDEDTYSDGDGGSWSSFTVQDDGSITGMELETMETVAAMIAEDAE